MAKKKILIIGDPAGALSVATAAAGLMPNGNFVKYDTTKTPEALAPAKKRQTRKKKPTGTVTAFIDESQNFAGLTDQEITTGHPPQSKSIYAQPQPEERPRNLAKEKKDRDVREVFTKLLKQGKSLRQARRLTKKKTGVPIRPDNSQPYVKPKNGKDS